MCKWLEVVAFVQWQLMLMWQAHDGFLLCKVYMKNVNGILCACLPTLAVVATSLQKRKNHEFAQNAVRSENSHDRH